MDDGEGRDREHQRKDEEQGERPQEYVAGHDPDDLRGVPAPYEPDAGAGHVQVGRPHHPVHRAASVTVAHIVWICVPPTCLAQPPGEDVEVTPRHSRWLGSPDLSAVRAPAQAPELAATRRPVSVPAPARNRGAPIAETVAPAVPGRRRFTLTSPVTRPRGTPAASRPPSAPATATVLRRRSVAPPTAVRQRGAPIAEQAAPTPTGRRRFTVGR